MKLPKTLQAVVDGFESLPGIGPKSAQRLAFYVMRMPKDDVLRFSEALHDLKENTRLCKTCFHVSETDECDICGDSSRDKNLLCVVETSLDVLALEKSRFPGIYHVLNGVINPLAGIGPDELFIDQLFSRAEKTPDLREIILATSTSLEGEATAMYIRKGLKNRFPEISFQITRIGRGLPIGADIEYADENTLSDALRSRASYEA